jgi:actin-like ATPase involved in cell morphogenesis
VGLDIGTMNLVSARKYGETVRTKRMRDAFIDLDRDLKNMLEMSDMSYIDDPDNDRLLVLGEPAFELSKMNVIDTEIRRPLSRGLISSDEIDAMEVLSILIENVVGDPVEEGEPCCFSVPADPIDMERDNTYHQSVFEKLLKEMGYNPIPSNEGMAVVYSECAGDGFSGVGISFGSGMINVSMSYRTIPTLQFSIARGGDWLDKKAAQSVNISQERMCGIKESEDIDIYEPDSREEEALSIYYRSLVDDALGMVASRFREQQNDVELDSAIPIVVSGGTSMVGGFVSFVREVFEDHRSTFPFDISEIRHAKDPLESVAQGLLVQAMQN